jgi:hypothetical protein
MARSKASRPHLLFGVFDHHLEDALLEGLGGAAEGHRTTRTGLQAEGGHLEGVGDGDGAQMALGFKKAHLGEQIAQARLVAGHGVDIALGRGAGHDGLDRGVPAPQIGAAQSPDA